MTDSQATPRLPGVQWRLAVFFVSSSAAFGAGTAVAGLLIMGRGDYGRWWVAVLIGAIGAGLLFGAAMTVFVSRMVRRRGGFATSRLLQKAVSAGRLPHGIDRPWVGVALFGGIGVWAPFDTERRLRGIHALQTALAQPDDGTSESERCIVPPTPPGAGGHPAGE